MENLIGKQVGNWLVIAFDEYRISPNGTKVPYWLCHCKCGVKRPVHGYHLRSGHSTQCRMCARKQTRKFTDTTKYCPRCKEWLPLPEFSNSKKTLSGRYGHCKVCDQTKRHGITKALYSALLVKQDGYCAILGCPEPPTQIDHDHVCCPNKKSCGRCVRGVLCGKHNLALGLFNDNPMELNKALDYINQFRTTLTSKNIIP